MNKKYRFFKLENFVFPRRKLKTRSFSKKKTHEVLETQKQHFEIQSRSFAFLKT